MTCSNCGREFDETTQRFCPNCGATMAPPVLKAPDVPPVRPLLSEAPPPLPVLEGPNPDGRLLTQSDFWDRFLGAVSVLVLNLGTPATIKVVLNSVAPSVGSTLVLYAICVTLHLLVLRKRFPAFAKGWKFGLITLAVIAVLSVLAILLLFVGILAVCSGMANNGHTGP